MHRDVAVARRMVRAYAGEVGANAHVVRAPDGEEMVMPTFLLLSLVVFVRAVGAILSGIVHLLLLPARIALAISPNVRDPRWILALGAALTAAVVVLLVATLVGSGR